MKTLTIILLRYQLKLAIKKRDRLVASGNHVIAVAYENAIKNYKSTLLYLRASRNSKLKRFFGWIS